ncbi:MAG: hypothetical protein ABMB14_11840 [Myxococcota bacterium]
MNVNATNLAIVATAAATACGRAWTDGATFEEGVSTGQYDVTFDASWVGDPADSALDAPAERVMVDFYGRRWPTTRTTAALDTTSFELEWDDGLQFWDCTESCVRDPSLRTDWDGDNRLVAQQWGGTWDAAAAACVPEARWVWVDGSPTGAQARVTVWNLQGPASGASEEACGERADEQWDEDTWALLRVDELIGALR